MQNLLSNFISAYLLVGYMVTIYVIVMFFISGRDIFYGVKDKLSKRDQFGYIVAMGLIMPILYFFYLREIGMLHCKCPPDNSHGLGE